MVVQVEQVVVQVDHLLQVAVEDLLLHSRHWACSTGTMTNRTNFHPQFLWDLYGQFQAYHLLLNTFHVVNLLLPILTLVLQVHINQLHASTLTYVLIWLSPYLSTYLP